MSKETSQSAAHTQIGEVELLFHPDQLEETEVHPLRGLFRFGPYSRSLLQAVIDPIRVAIVAPHGGVKAVQRLLGELNGGHFPKERKAYLDRKSTRLNS